ncbi:Putative heterokaryon incompatibility protein 6 protein similar to HET6 of Neurospora crassa [Podospora comata]|uniref:Heterokaryon incompatibility protein 6 protein similar to HET6 of Neurospora crassa n=1 Tax=Podospora comata TaxID=48703 RepID=A0ABY6SHC1_PODCO|nr:Putative heterokaryon incompatibility protein 6 protein similar to HET6 of Neurospora crassa [Podospora comata]
MDMFSYLPLNHDIHEIRLITLQYPDPTSGEEPTGCTSTVPPPIKLTLGHVSLDAQPAPDYSALSYVWGDANDTQPIIVEGRIFQVTRNLFTALERLYADGFSGKIWIDAICINQSDNDEKAVQVQLMSSIYSRAEEVFIWLGPEPDGGALQTITQLSALFELEVMNKFRAGNAVSLLETFAENLMKIAATAGGRNIRARDFDFAAIFRLCTERPWWRRVWVIQELVLAKKATFLCGEASTSWESVQNCAETCTYIQLGRDVWGKAQWFRAMANCIAIITFHLVRVCYEYKRTLEEADWNKDRAGMTLINALYCVYALQGNDGGHISVSDRRDIIYGILGLVRPEDRCRIPVDYSNNMTWEKTLLETSKVLLMDHGPDVLTHHKSNSASLPSWVIDWTSEVATFGGIEVGTRNRNHYDASKGKSWKNWSSKCQIEQASYAAPKISLFGRIVSQVVTVGRVFKHADFTLQDADGIRQWLLEIMEMLESYGVSQVDANPAACNGVSRELLRSTLNNIWRVPIMDRSGKERVNDENKAILIAGFDALTGKRQPPPEVVGDEEKKAWILAESRDYTKAWRLEWDRAFIDSMGRPGLTLPDVQVGDQVVILAGGHAPFIIRPIEDMDGSSNIRYLFVGAAYIYGLMDGEAMEGDPDFQEFWLV